LYKIFGEVRGFWLNQGKHEKRDQWLSALIYKAIVNAFQEGVQ